MITSKIQPHADTGEQAGTPVRQISVFLNNRVGALLSLIKLLRDHHIAVLGLSLQDNTELAIVRLIVSDPESAGLLFIEKGIPHAVCRVTVVELRETESSLLQVLASLLEAEINVAFSYPLLVRPTEYPLLVLHIDSPTFSASVLTNAGFKVMLQEDLSR